MKLVLAQQYPYETDRFPGGVHTAGYYLARGLQARGDVDVRVLTVSGQADSDMDRVDQGLRVRFLSEPKVRLIPNMTRNIRRLTRNLKALSPDLVNGNLVVYAVAGVRSGIPTVFTVHGVIHKEAQVWTKPADRLRYALYVRYDREAVSRVKHIIATSPYVVGEYDGKTEAKFHVIDNCIDPRFFEVENREEPGRLLYGGLVYDRKNVLGLLEITRRLVESHPDLKLRIAGKIADQAYYASCLSFIRQHGIVRNVDFRDVDGGQLTRALRATKLLLPSNRRPRAVISRIDRGQAVVASTVRIAFRSMARTAFGRMERDDRFVEYIDGSSQT